MDRVQDGSFHNSDELLMPGGRHVQEKVEAKAHSIESYERILTSLRNVPELSPQLLSNIYVPASYSEISPSVVFPDATITYLDIDPEPVAALQQAGHTAIIGDINTHIPEPLADLTVMIETNGLEDRSHIVQTVREGGYIFENHYSGAPEEYLQDSNLILIGVFKEGDPDEVSGGDIRFDPTVLAEDYLKGERSEAGVLKRNREDRGFLFRRKTFRESLPDYFQEYYVGEEELEFKGNKYRYAILDESLAPSLPNFVGYPNGTLLFISNKVPEKYRYFMLTHEIDEITNMAGEPGRCAKALRAELSRVPEDLLHEYVEFRRRAFADLFIYLEQQDNDHDRATAKEVLGSIAYLDSLSLV